MNRKHWTARSFSDNASSSDLTASTSYIVRSLPRRGSPRKKSLHLGPDSDFGGLGRRGGGVFWWAERLFPGLVWCCVCVIMGRCMRWVDFRIRFPARTVGTLFNAPIATSRRVYEIVSPHRWRRVVSELHLPPRSDGNVPTSLSNSSALIICYYFYSAQHRLLLILTLLVHRQNRARGQNK